MWQNRATVGDYEPTLQHRKACHRLSSDSRFCTDHGTRMGGLWRQPARFARRLPSTESVHSCSHYRTGVLVSVGVTVLRDYRSRRQFNSLMTVANCLDDEIEGFSLDSLGILGAYLYGDILRNHDIHIV